VCEPSLGVLERNGKVHRLAQRNRLIYADSRELTSGLEPLTCSLRVIHHALQWCAQECKSRIPRRLPLLGVAACCTALRSRWYQSGINIKVVSLLARNFLVPGLRLIVKALQSPMTMPATRWSPPHSDGHRYLTNVVWIKASTLLEHFVWAALRLNRIST